MIQRYYTKKHVAAHFCVHPGTIDRWVRDGLFPPPMKVSKNGVCRWSDRSLGMWEDAQSTDQSPEQSPEAKVNK